MEKDVVTLKLLFTRHGETEDNLKGTICGQQPGVLTKLGKEQAQKIGVFLKNNPTNFDQIYVSDLGRTVATFQQIKSQAKYLEKLPLCLTKLIREKGGGVLEGRSLGTWKQMADKEGKGIREYKCDKGESWQDVNSRCRQFVLKLIENHLMSKSAGSQEMQIFAVAHGGVLMEFHNLVGELSEKKAPVFRNTAKNCSFHEFLLQYPADTKECSLDNLRISCLRENITDHLK